MSGRVRVPVRRPGCEVGVDHEGGRSDAAQIVDDRRDRVVRHVAEVPGGDVGVRVDQTGDHRLGTQPFEHEREGLIAELEHEGRLAAAGVQRQAAVVGEEMGCRQRCRQGVALTGVEGAVVDAGGAVGARRRLVGCRAHPDNPALRVARLAATRGARHDGTRSCSPDRTERPAKGWSAWRGERIERIGSAACPVPGEPRTPAGGYRPSARAWPRAEAAIFGHRVPWSGSHILRL